MSDYPDVLTGSLTGYRCKMCGGSLYVNGMMDSWCSQCSRGGDDVQPLDVTGPYIPIHAPESRIIEALRAELERVKGERDAYLDTIENAWITLFAEQVPMLDDFEHLPLHIEGHLSMLSDVLRERDEARRWAGVWKRSAKMWRGEAHDWTSTTDSIGVGESVGDRYRRVK